MSRQRLLDHALNATTPRADVDILPVREQIAPVGKAVVVARDMRRGGSKDPLLKRPNNNGLYLVGPGSLRTEAISTRLRIAYEGGWLLASVYSLKEQIRTARTHLPRNNSPALPLPIHGLPRVCDLALKAIARRHWRVDPNRLDVFVRDPEFFAAV